MDFEKEINRIKEALATHVHSGLDSKELSSNLNKDSEYSVSNVTTDRSYNADSTSTAELADVLGTLIEDLKTLGIIN